MARQITETGGIELLEDAFQLLRELPAPAWTAFCAGAVPFLLAILFFIVDMSSTAASVELCILESFGLAILFVWLNCCRVRFSAYLRASLDGTGAPRRWTAAETARIAAAQSFLQPFKFVVLPFAFLAAVPYPWSVAFFRNLYVLGDSPDQSIRSLISRSSRQARLWQRQNWTLLSVVSLLTLMLIFNFAMLLFLLPQLFRSFTGYENEFTRSAEALANWTSTATIWALTWFALDPLLQAAYAIRCFHGDSLRTGQDLLAQLRRVAIWVFAAYLLAAAPVSTFAQPPPPTPRAESPAQAPRVRPPELDRAADEVLKQRQYAWRLGAPPRSPQGAVEGFFDTIARLVRKTFQALQQALDRLVRWIRNLVSPSDEMESVGKAPVQPLRWTIYALVAILITALAVFLVRFRALRKVARPVPAIPGPSAIDLSKDNLVATDLPEDEWLALARQCLDNSNYQHALRALYLASLAMLARGGMLSIHACKSNHDYERELNRRARGTPLPPLFGENLLSFERAWYGFHAVTQADLEHFQKNLNAMRPHAN